MCVAGTYDSEIARTSYKIQQYFTSDPARTYVNLSRGRRGISRVVLFLLYAYREIHSSTWTIYSSMHIHTQSHSGCVLKTGFLLPSFLLSYSKIWFLKQLLVCSKTTMKIHENTERNKRFLFSCATSCSYVLFRQIMNTQQVVGFIRVLIFRNLIL